MAATRIVSIIGRHNAGKTTLLVALASEFVRRKFRVMTMKHGAHPATLDTEGKDSWRHWQEGKAERVLLEAPGARLLLERTKTEADPVTLARRYLDGADIVLAEGFSSHPLPKIEVHRRQCGPPVFDATRPDAADWIAILSDDASYRAPFPVFRFSDTSWLMTLANMAWDRAKVIGP